MLPLVAWLGYLPILPMASRTHFSGIRPLAAEVLYVIIYVVFVTLGFLCLLYILRLLLRNQAAAVAASVLLLGLALGGGDLSNSVLMLVMVGYWCFILMRLGFLAGVVGYFSANVLSVIGATLDFSAWYAGYGYAVLAVFAAIVLGAFRNSLGGRPILAMTSIDD